MPLIGTLWLLRGFPKQSSFALVLMMCCLFLTCPIPLLVSIVLINIFFIAGEEFIRYLLSATLAEGMASGSGVQVESSLLSLLSPSPVPVPKVLRRITTTVYRDGK